MTSSDNWTDFIIRLSILYSRLYTGKGFEEGSVIYGKTFIDSFNKFPGMRDIARSIKSVYKNTGLINECTEDFSEYCKKFPESELLNTNLKIISAIKKWEPTES